VETCFTRFEDRLARAGQGAADPFDALRSQCRAYTEFGTAEPRGLTAGRDCRFPGDSY